MNSNSIELNDLKKALQVIERINSIPLAEIEFTDNGKQIILTEEQKEDWKFLGMSNSLLAQTFLIK